MGTQMETTEPKIVGGGGWPGIRDLGLMTY